jgi:hypothetical protein
VTLRRRGAERSPRPTRSEKSSRNDAKWIDIGTITTQLGFDYDRLTARKAYFILADVASASPAFAAARRIRDSDTERSATQVLQSSLRCIATGVSGALKNAG